jgi:hypothetical protein
MIEKMKKKTAMGVQQSNFSSQTIIADKYYVYIAEFIL